MRKAYIALLAGLLPIAALGQSAIDAQQVTQSDFKGTARFMAMGGAFTALGGDLSTLNQNPAGIGIYRSSEIGVSLGIDFQRNSTSPSSMQFPSHQNQTKVYCNNFGYVGATNLSGALRTLNWGVSYNRAVSFDRIYSGYVGNTTTSLSNYVAAYSSAAGYSASQMEFDDAKGYNPYFDSNIDWLSILSYSAYMINPTNAAGNSYQGLYQNGVKSSDALFNVRESGYVDEYNFSVGGNVENFIYWGLSVGVTDLKYIRSTYYSEYLEGAQVYNEINGGTTLGDAAFDLSNRKYINGNGWNIKLGMIFKPINELRIGFAVHTPTWYSFTQGYDGVVDYGYYNPLMPEGKQELTGNDYTEYADFSWRLAAPWRFMVGVAGVIANKAIISMDYQYDGYGSQRVSIPDYTGFVNSYQPFDAVNQDIKNYFKASNTVRLGLEYRVTSQFSVRAGYNITTSNVRAEAADGAIEVLTSGTDPSYTFNKNTQHITAGLGYRYKAWYIDLAYVYKNREGRFHAFTNFAENSPSAQMQIAPQVKLSENNSMVVISTGFKF